MSNVLWQLFVKTGDIKYYNLYKKNHHYYSRGDFKWMKKYFGNYLKKQEI